MFLGLLACVAASCAVGQELSEGGSGTPSPSPTPSILPTCPPGPPASQQIIGASGSVVLTLPSSSSTVGVVNGFFGPCGDAYSEYNLDGFRQTWLRLELPSGLRLGGNLSLHTCGDGSSVSQLDTTLFVGYGCPAEARSFQCQKGNGE